jgi:simple sugar transport system substrate-binding protein
MTDLSKRSLIKVAAITALAGATLIGCGKKEEAAAPAPAPAAEAPQVTKAAWVYIGPVGDAGWSYAHDLGRRGTYVESVPYGADAERVFRDLAQQGNQIIFGTSFGYMETMLKVAEDFPNVKFEHATGYKTAPNMRIYDASFYQDTYMAGVIAGHMTQTGTLGFVGSFPIPEVLRNINAFTLGAQSVKPDVKVRVVWVSSWFDPPKESEAAQALINQGADVLLQNTDSTAVLQTAERNGKFAFGWDSDMSAFAPNAHLASAIVDWTPYYVKSIEELRNGTWETKRTVWGVKEGLNDLIKIADFVPAEAKAKVEEIKAGMKAGTFEPFTGPIVDNTGREVLAAGVQADRAWKDSVNFFVRGIEGRVPTGN